MSKKATSSDILQIDPSRLLTEADDVSSFDCGEEIVDKWLKDRAHKAQKSGTARVFVVQIEGTIAGYYSLSAHCVVRRNVRGGWFTRNAPEQVPTVLLGMLGVDKRYQGMHLGSSLLGDAIHRALSVSEEIGTRALIVDPLNTATISFYKKYGFKELPGTSRMFLSLA